MKAKKYPSYYQAYIRKIPEEDSKYLLKEGINDTLRLLALISEDKANESYEVGKWSIKDVVQHLIDTERIFCFRALSFARGEEKKINGFEHDDYAREASANDRSLKSLLEEFKAVRVATIGLFESFTPEMLKKEGNANGLNISVEQLQYIIIGHEIHHRSILQEKYIK